MKKWKKRLLVLAAALTMCLLMGTLVPAANSDSLPLDGVERQFAKLGTSEDEPAQVGAAQKVNVVKVGYDSATDAEIYRIKCSGSGLLTVSGRNDNNGLLYLQLLNGSKKNINANGSWNTINSYAGRYAYYGVKKGTYYLKVYSPTYYYRLGASLAKKSNKGGSNMSKSRGLSYNKTITGVMPGNEDWKKCDWYTFYLPTPQRIRLYFKLQGEGYFNLRLYGPGTYSSGKLIDSGINNEDNYYNLYRQYYGLSGQYARSAGRYYVRIERSSANYKRSSCVYWLRYKYY